MEKRSTRPHTALTLAAAITCLLLVPSLVSAQAIGGTVTDATGGILPGVTVEARSPVLIESVRTAVTDGRGQYLIIALEAGVYSVTFTLPGFSTLVREAVELGTGFTANINVELAVGTLSETITVTEASPVVDVQTTRRAEIIDREIFELLPTTRGYDSLALLIPAMNIQGGPTTTIPVDTGGIGGEGNNRLSIHGSDEEDSEIQIDGFDSNLVALEGAPQGTPFDTAVAEYVYDYSSNTAEVETGGVRLNMIPKEGSNVFSGGFYTNFAHSSWLAKNVSQELIDRGIVGGKDGGVKMDQSWYIGPSIGGPIVRDKLWFFSTYSYRRGSIFPASLFHNTDTSALAYVPDLDQPARDRSDIYEGTLRLTWQATTKDKVQAYWSNNHTRQVPSLTGSQLFPIFIAPEAGSEVVTSVNTYQVSWVRPQNNNILFEAGFSTQPAHNVLYPLDDRGFGPGNGANFMARTDLPSVFEFSNLTMSRNMGFFFRGTDVHFSTANTGGRGSMSIVTGSHNLKFGTSIVAKRQMESYRSCAGTGPDCATWTSMATFLGLPVQAYFDSRPPETNLLTNIGIYAQDQWTLDRLTVNAGLRFDYFNGGYPDQASGPLDATNSIWVPQGSSVAGATAAIWKDLQPRLGVVYDLTGDGRTAVKASINRFGGRDAISLAAELNPVANNTRDTRAWFDGAAGHPIFAPGGGLPACIPSVADPTASMCIAGDGLVQGNPLDPNPNGELLSGPDNPAFGRPIVTEFFDPAWAFGWGTKKANWELAMSVERELLDGVSVDFGYFRRTYVNLNDWDNRAWGLEDFDTYTITVAEDPRLPDGGGYPLTLVDLKPEALGRIPDNIQTLSENLGGESEQWHGMDFNFSARLEGVLLQGGVATGRRTTDFCGLQALQPESIWNEEANFPASRVGRGTTGQLAGIAGSRGNAQAANFCRAEDNWLTNVSVFGSYTFPYDIDISAAFFSRPGPRREAIYRVPNADVLAALGRTSSLTSGAVSLNVLPPGTVYGDRFDQLDLRFAKLVNFGLGGNVRASFDIYNVFNGNAVSREQQAINPGLGDADQYLTPLGIQPGRLAKVSFQFNF